MALCSDRLSGLGLLFVRVLKIVVFVPVVDSLQLLVGRLYYLRLVSPGVAGGNVGLVASLVVGWAFIGSRGRQELVGRAVNKRVVVAVVLFEHCLGSLVFLIERRS